MVQVYASGGDITGWALYALEGVLGAFGLLLLSAVFYFTPKAIRYAAKEKDAMDRVFLWFVICALLLCAIAIEILIVGGLTGYVH